jgi:hypothetical protein
LLTEADNNNWSRNRHFGLVPEFFRFRFKSAHPYNPCPTPYTRAHPPEVDSSMPTKGTSEWFFNPGLRPREVLRSPLTKSCSKHTLPSPNSHNKRVLASRK